MKKTTITLKKGDVALVFTAEYDVHLYLTQADDSNPVSGIELVAVAIAELIDKGNKEFTALLIKTINDTFGRDDGS